MEWKKNNVGITKFDKELSQLPAMFLTYLNDKV